MKLRSPFARLATAVVAIGIAAAACSNSSGDESTDTGASSGSTVANSSPGVTDTEIRFASLGTNKNNPLGTCVLECFEDGVKAYFAYRNSEGGVYGRDLVLDDPIDDEVGQNKQDTLKIISENKTFGVMTYPVVASGWDDLEEKGVPTYTVPWYAAEMAGKENVFAAAGAACITCTFRTYAYLGELTGATKIAALGYGVSQSSKDCTSSIVSTINAYKEQTGQEIVYQNDSLAFGLPNGVGPEVTAMKKAGVQLVLTCVDANGQKTIAQELGRQGLADVPMYHANSYDLDAMKEAGDLFKGDIVGMQLLPFDAAEKGNSLGLFKKWMAETDSKLSDTAAYGWAVADLAYEGIKAAGPNFTRQSVIDATNKITDFTAGGLIPTTDWSRQHETPTQEDASTHGAPQDCIALVKFTGDKFEPVGVSTAEKPFACWSNANRDYSKPTATSFS